MYIYIYICIYIYYYIILYCFYSILYYTILYIYIYITHQYTNEIVLSGSSQPTAHNACNAGVYLLAPFAAALATGPRKIAAARRQRCAGTVQLSSRTLVISDTRRWWKCQKLQEDHVV